VLAESAQTRLQARRLITALVGFREHIWVICPNVLAENRPARFPRAHLGDLPECARENVPADRAVGLV
jgi:hypothetical protein